MNKIEHQHGDLLFQVVDVIPKESKKVKNLQKGYVLERGEGIHTHILQDVKGIEVFEIGTDIYMRVSKPVRIDHEEHGIQTLQPGKKYKKAIEQVYDYETEESRRTID